MLECKIELVSYIEVYCRFQVLFPKIYNSPKIFLRVLWFNGGVLSTRDQGTTGGVAVNSPLFCTGRLAGLFFHFHFSYIPIPVSDLQNYLFCYFQIMLNDLS